MKTRLIISIIIIICILALSAYSQDYQAFYTKSQLINRSGMFVLGGWAVTNIVSGAIGWTYTSGESKYFFQMNLFWNTVNLAIAGFGLAGTFSIDLLTMTHPEMLDKHLKSERLFLINAGLDILYIGGGLYMKHLSSRKEKNKDLLSGYGKSVMLQGGFLLVFDTVMYLIQRNHRIQFLDHPVMDISFTPAGISCIYKF